MSVCSVCANDVKGCVGPGANSSPPSKPSSLNVSCCLGCAARHQRSCDLRGAHPSLPSCAQALLKCAECPRVNRYSVRSFPRHADCFTLQYYCWLRHGYVHQPGGAFLSFKSHAEHMYAGGGGIMTTGLVLLSMQTSWAAVCTDQLRRLTTYRNGRHNAYHAPMYASDIGRTE